MVSVRANFWGHFYFHFSLVFHDFEGFLIKKKNSQGLVGYEMIIANSRWLSIISYPMHARGIIVKYIPQFSKLRRCEKDLKDNKHNSLHLGRKYALDLTFVPGHYLFLVAHSFPRATLSENCFLLGTDNVYGQIS